MAWWDNFAYYKRVTVIASMIAAIIAASVGILNTLQAGEPHWVATRGFVRVEVLQANERTQANLKTTLDAVAGSEKKLQQQQAQIEAQVLEGRLENIKSKINDRELLVQQKDGPQEYKNLVQDQINEYKDRLKGIQQKLEQIRAVISGGP